MPKKVNPPDATGRNVRHGNKRDDTQDEHASNLSRRLDGLQVRIFNLEKMHAN